MSEVPRCRRAGAADADAITDLLALAFAHDPLWGWAMRRPGADVSHHARLWRIYVDGALRYPWTWLTAGGEAAALWTPPGGTEMSEAQEQTLAEVAEDVLGPWAGVYLEVVHRFSVAHPTDQPHYYLGMLGTHPAHRGRGLGMALLAQTLAMVDEAGLPAYLESTNPANNSRYASVGFEPIGEFSAPNDGPTVTTMWRPAQ